MAQTLPVRHRKHYFDLTDRKLPLTLGILTAALGIWDGFRGVSALINATLDHEQTIAAIRLLGNLYLLLTGLWLATRDSLTPKRTVGLTLMLAGILAGTWAGTAILAANKDDFALAQIAFFAGLFIHLLGVLYTRKE